MKKSSKAKKEILVNMGSLESRVAILEEGRLAELHLEREPRVVGNIYKARVVNVLPGMEAAFVDIGLPKHAFLSPEDEVYVTQESKDSDAMVFRKLQRKPLGGITVGEELLVQVNRAAVASKGARVSTRLALPGRYLVLLLTDAGRIGISRKIESERTRQRLRKIGEDICPSDCGIILRTEALGARQPQINKDMEFLIDLKRSLLEKASEVHAPALVHQDFSLVLRIIRDYFTLDVERVSIDSEEVFKSARELVGRFVPRLKRRVMPYKEDTPILERFGVEQEVDRLWQRKVWLKAGGYISIDQTEAVCAIDVNTARFTGKAKGGLAGTILQTNLEAAEEIARQLRLRDLGGQIIIDFIDMRSHAHRAKVQKAFQEALSRDRAKTRVLPISQLGIVEMTRKKHGESLREIISEPCSRCSGVGRMPNAVSVLLQIQRELRGLVKERSGVAFAIWVSPQVAGLLVGAGGEQLRQLTKRLQKPLYVRSRGKDILDYEVAALSSSQIEERLGAFYAGQQLNCRWLDEESDIALSEEGYLVELQATTKAKKREGTFQVELLRADPAIGFGRIAGEPAPPKEEPSKRKGGISRRGYRRSRRQKTSSPKPSEAEKIDIREESQMVAAVEKPTAKPSEETTGKKPHRRRRRPRKKESPKPEAKSSKQSTEQPSKPKEQDLIEKKQAEETTRDSRRSRRPRRRRKPVSPPAETTEMPSASQAGQSADADPLSARDAQEQEKVASEKTQAGSAKSRSRHSRRHYYSRRREKSKSESPSTEADAQNKKNDS